MRSEHVRCPQSVALSQRKLTSGFVSVTMMHARVQTLTKQL